MAWTKVQNNQGSKKVAKMTQPVSEEYINLLDIIFRKIETMIVAEKILDKMYMGYNKNPRPETVVSLLSGSENRNDSVTVVPPIEGPLLDVLLTGVDIVFHRWQMLASRDYKIEADILKLALGSMQKVSKIQKRKAVSDANSESVVKKSKTATRSRTATVEQAGDSKPAAKTKKTGKKQDTIDEDEASDFASEASLPRIKTKVSPTKKRKPRKSAVDSTLTVDEVGNSDHSDTDDGTLQAPVAPAVKAPTLESLQRQAAAESSDTGDDVGSVKSVGSNVVDDEASGTDSVNADDASEQPSVPDEAENGDEEAENDDNAE